MYAKTISLLVGSNNVYGIIFYKVYLILKCTSYHVSTPPPPPSPVFYCVILAVLYLTSISPQHLYQGVKKYVVIVSMNIYWSKPSENIIPNSIFIIF